MYFIMFVYSKRSLQCLIFHLSSDPCLPGLSSSMAEVMQCTLPPKQLCQGLSKKKVSLTIVVSEVCEVVCQFNDGMQYNWLGSTDMCSHLRKGSFQSLASFSVQR